MQIYLRLLAASIRARMAYRWNFLMTTWLYGCVTAIDFATIAIVLSRFKVVGGWDVYEVALLAGIASTSFGLYRSFASELHEFESYLITGSFDAILVRPYPPLLTLLAQRFEIARIGALLQGLLVLGIGLRAFLQRGGSPLAVIYIACLPLFGFAIMVGLNLVVAGIGFWITRIEQLQHFVLGAPMAAAQYPLAIFPAWLRRVLTGILPVGAWGYYPLCYLLGKGGTPLALGAPLTAALAMLAVGLLAWELGLRRYQSTGS
jgi:ABC-2 type transport system permease protein